MSHPFKPHAHVYAPINWDLELAALWKQRTLTIVVLATVIYIIGATLCRKFASYIYFNSEMHHPPIIPHFYQRIDETSLNDGMHFIFCFWGALTPIILYIFFHPRKPAIFRLADIVNQGALTFAISQFVRPFFYIPLAYWRPTINLTSKCEPSLFTSPSLIDMWTLPPCADLIFSGHASVMVTLILVNYEYSYYFLSERAYRVLIASMVAYNAIEVSIILLMRSHHVEDLLVAIIICVGIWHQLMDFRSQKTTYSERDESNQNEWSSIRKERN